MEVSKLTFTEETRMKLANPMLNQKKRSQLRIELVKEYIRNKPAGTKILTSELFYAAQYPRGKEAAGHQFIGKLIKNGTITKETIPKSHKCIWTVPGDTHIVKPADKKPEPQEEKADDKCYCGPNLEIGLIEKAAKNFVWNTGSFDVREFIGWLKK